MARANDPIQIAIEQLDRVQNDPDLQEDDLPVVHEIISKLQGVADRNPMVGFAVAS